MALLEREAATGALEAAVARASAGRGSVVLVTGEAGAGKTALLKAVASTAACPWTWGWCDALPTPVPLAPWRDVAAEAGLLDPVGVDVDRVRWTVLAWLRAGPARVVVIEDAHWADDATALVLRFVARRIAALPAVVVVTARDEGSADAPGRLAMTQLAGWPDVVRVPLSPLSEAAVGALARGAGRDAEQLYAITGGNPFLLTEALTAPSGTVPQGAAGSVRARLLALEPWSRALVERAAVAPGRSPLSLLVPGAHRDAADEAVLAGLLEIDGGTVSFRHELVRLAVLDQVPPMRRAALHAAALAALADAPGADPAALAHHADGAHDATAAARHHTEAASRASEAGAHRQAVRHLEAALARRHVLGPADLARLHRRRSEELHALRGAGAAEPDAVRAVQLLRQQDVGPLELGDALRWQARTTPDAAAGQRLLSEALGLLSPLGPTPELAAAHALESTLLMLARELGSATAAAERAMSLSRSVGDVPALEAALQARGCARVLQGDAGGAEDLREAVALASAHGLEAEAGRAHSNLVSAAGEACVYDLADEAIADALPFLVGRDLDSHVTYVRAWQARCLFERGRWDQAAATAGAVLDAELASDIAVLLALTVRGRLLARRGNRGAHEALDDAMVRARGTGLLQRVGPVAAARAEALWLTGQQDTGQDGLLEAFERARRVRHPWLVGELALALHRHGLMPQVPVDVVEQASEPFRLHLRGEARAAAETWDRLGRPYEAADALTGSDRTDDLRDAHARFTALGARPARESVARTLRARGVTDLPRGPRTATRLDPFGLTPRQQEVHALVRRGLTDPEIAAALHLSVKTVGHHVSAVLAKTGATSRRTVPEPVKDGEDLPMSRERTRP